MFADSTTPRDTSQALQPGGTRRRLARTATLGLTASLVILGMEMTPALAADVNGGTLALDGTAKTATTTIANDNAYLTFAGTSGQKVVFSTSGSSFASSPVITLQNPSAATIGTFSGGVLDVTTLPTTGTYKVYIDPNSSDTGSVTVQAWNVAADVAGGALTTDGTTKNLATAPGQNATATIAATAGQRYMIQTTSSTYNSDPAVTLTNPSASVVASWSGNSLIDTMTFAATGTYTIKVDPVGANAGNINVRAWLVAADPTPVLPTNGTQTTVSTATGQNSASTFAVTAGQRFMIQTTGSTYGSDPAVTLTNPSASVVASWSGNSVIDTMTLAATGNYTVKVDPSGTQSGSVGIKVWLVAPDPTPALPTNGSVTTVSTATGQNSLGTFTATAGQRFMIETSGNTYSTNPAVSLIKPDGTTVVASWSGNFLLDTTTLSTAGTYTVKVDPSGTQSGSIGIAVWAVPPDAASALNINEATSTAATLSNVIGQNVGFTFSGTAGGRVQIQTSGNTYSSSQAVQLLAPDGSLVKSWSGGTVAAPPALVDTLTLPQTGSYKLFVNPPGKTTGQITAQVWNVPADIDGGALNPNGADKVLSTPYGGMGTWATFNVTTVGQRFQIQTAGNTYNPTTRVYLVMPNGNLDVSWYGNAPAHVYTFNTAGTWKVLLDPRGRSTGQITVSAQALAPDVDGGALATDGTATTLTTTSNGQNAFVTIPATAGQRIQLKTSGTTFAKLPNVALIDPDGLPVDSWFGDSLRKTVTFNKTGTWKVMVTPAGKGVGSINVQGWAVPADVDAGTLALDGTPVSVTTVAGQGAKMTFSATAGQRIMFQSLNGTYDPTAKVVIQYANGNEFKSWYGDNMTQPLKITRTGVYTVLVQPRARSVGGLTIKAWDVPADVDAGSLTIGGAAKTLTTTAGGQQAYVSFSGSNGMVIKIETTNSSFNNQPNIQLVRANGDVVYSHTGEFVSKNITLPVTGTYKIVMDPQDRTVGSIKVKAYQP